MYFARRPLISLLLIGIFLASCGGQPAASEPTPDVNATIASGAQTMVASVFQTQTAAAPTVTNTASPTVTAASTTSPMALPSPLATFTQGFVFFATATPTGTFYTPTPNPNTLSYGCNNLLLIESFTEPEGPFQPGQSFEQNWQVANTGTCDWLYLYELVYVSGERMSGNSRRLSKKNRARQVDNVISGVGSSGRCWNPQRFLAFHRWRGTRVRIHPPGIYYSENAHQDTPADNLSIKA